jgi:hypothetical protein
MLEATDRMSEHPGREHDIDETADPSPVGGGPEHEIRFVELEFIKRSSDVLVRMDDAMRVHDAFGHSG